MANLREQSVRCLRGLQVAVLGGLCVQVLSQPTGAMGMDVVRERALVRMVRQDCGSCHGMRLTGGLGPALTPAALLDKPIESLAATIYHGRPGTPMPPWKAMLAESEALWIAQQLVAGFPAEVTTNKP